METSTSTIISKVWSFCHVLKDDGVSYGDYLEQLTYLIFLKLADEFSKPPYKREIAIPKAYNWETLSSKRGAELETHYTRTLRELGKTKGILGQIFTKSQNKIQDPAKLYRIIDMINNEQWTTMGADIKGPDLRRVVGKKCRGHEKRSRAVLYPEGIDPGNGGVCASPTEEDHL